MRALVVALVLAGCGDAFEQANETALVATQEGGSDGKQETEAHDAQETHDAQSPDAPDVSGGAGGVAGGAGSAGVLDASDDGESEAEAEAPDAGVDADASPEVDASVCPSAACTEWCASLGKVDTCQAGACVCVS